MKSSKVDAKLFADLLRIVRHLKEVFDTGADKVYRDSIAIGDDDRTLEDYVRAAVDKADGIH